MGDTTEESPTTTPADQDTAVSSDTSDNGLTEEEETTKEKADPTTESSEPATSSKAKSSSKKVPYVHDPNKITLRFLFANRDGLSVIIKCNPSDTVGEVKGALISVWPKELPECSGGGDSLRLICMGKGVLTPDSRTLLDFEVPVFRTHPTPVNVAVRPQPKAVEASSKKASGSSGNGGDGTVGQGCACVIL